VSPATVVWSLELTDPARLRPPARPARRPLQVERSTAPGTSERLYRSVGAGWQWTDRLGWSAARWAAWEAGVETHVARVDGEEAGYVELDASQPGAVEVAYFGLLPAFHGAGLGGHLLTFGLRRALELAPRVWVHTCSLDGPHALANYQARGLELFRTETVLR
jgi:GNAT superfamily N-acetyltransferase